MKRPPGLWILLSAGVLCLSLQNVFGLKATELIFGKSSTTTTTTETVPDGATLKDEVSTELAENATKSNFTGNPQIDYIYDPNLPRELNGYNLSSYPFYNGMPEDIDFKCDGLHDGFYASVPHKCQLYHHCLFGTRYDFLCANYTAFDQKTFICQFVSEVDCNNSHKYWHRNDALYQAATTTTTVKPTPISVSPALTASPRRPPPAVRRRRPSRRRPQYEYYDDDYEEEDRDDYYEEPPRRRRKRPRPRPRPIYDDYDYYEEDRHERRGGSGRRTEDRREPDRRKEYDRREYEDRRRYKEDRRRDYDDRPDPPRHDKESESDYRSDHDKKKEDDRKRRPAESDNNPRYENRRPVDEPRNERPKNNRKPYDDESYEDRRNYDRPRNSTPQENVQPLVKPNSSSSIYNQPRMAPRIRPPVPRNEQNKFAYKTTMEPVPSKKPPKEDKFEDYDYELPPQRPNLRPKVDPEPRTERKPAKASSERDTRRGYDSRPRQPVPKKPLYDFDDYEDGKNKSTRPQVKPRYEFPSRDKTSNRQTTEIYEDVEQYDQSDSEELANSKEQKQKIEPAVSSTTKEPLRDYQENVRIVKRPFLPSRGGNPFSTRGLLPVGAKALDITQHETDTSTEQNERRYSQDSSEVQNGRRFPESNLSLSKETNLKSSQVTEEEEQKVALEEKEEVFKPSPILVKVINRSKNQESSGDDDFTPLSHRPQTPTRSNIKAKEYNSPSRKNPLDINENEYDVTLNDALNPTIPNLPIRNFPTGFSGQNDYNYDNYNRQRFDNFNRATQNRFQVRSPSQKIETVASPYLNPPPRKYIEITDSVYQNYRPNPQITQAQTHGFYSVY